MMQHFRNSYGTVLPSVINHSTSVRVCVPVGKARVNPHMCACLVGNKSLHMQTSVSMLCVLMYAGALLWSLPVSQLRHSSPDCILR